MKINLKGLEYFLLAIGIFTDVRIEPLIMLLAVLLVYSRGGNITWNRSILLGFGVLTVWSLLAILMVGYSPWKFVQQFILLFYFFSAYHILFNNNRDHINDIFRMYLRVAFVLCILGLLQFAVLYLTGFDIFFMFKEREYVLLETGNITRISSICAEPGNFSRVITPALGYYLFKDHRDRKEWTRFLVILLTFFLTFSTMSYVIFFAMVGYKYLIIKKNIIVRAAATVLSCIVAVFIFNIITATEGKIGQGEDRTLLSDVSIKIRDVVGGFKDFTPETIETLNLSSYATLMNVWVALNAPNRVFGTGLGTHEQNYQNVYYSDSEFYGLNMQEGYALANRLYSELGLAGIFLFVWFLYKCHNKKNIINICVFFALLTVTFRGGHYTRYGTIFFLFLYYYTSTYVQKGLRMAEGHPDEPHSDKTAALPEKTNAPKQTTP